MNSPELPVGAKPAVTPRKPRTTSAPRRTATASDTAAPKAAGSRSKSAAVPAISGDERRRMIEICAYFLAEQRGFAPGCHEQDWLEAEARVDVMLAHPTRKGGGAKRSTQ